MKLRVIGLMAFLFAGNVAAEEIFLTCQGYQANGEIVVRDARFNEEGGTWHFTNQDGEQAWESAQDNELSDFELDMVSGGAKGMGRC